MGFSSSSSLCYEESEGRKFKQTMKLNLEKKMSKVVLCSTWEIGCHQYVVKSVRKDWTEDSVGKGADDLNVIPKTHTVQ